MLGGKADFPAGVRSLPHHQSAEEQRRRQRRAELCDHPENADHQQVSRHQQKASGQQAEGRLPTTSLAASFINACPASAARRISPRRGSDVRDVRKCPPAQIPMPPALEPRGAKSRPGSGPARSGKRDMLSDTKRTGPKLCAPEPRQPLRPRRDPVSCVPAIAQGRFAAAAGRASEEPGPEARGRRADCRIGRRPDPGPRLTPAPKSASLSPCPAGNGRVRLAQRVQAARPARMRSSQPTAISGTEASSFPV